MPATSEKGKGKRDSQGKPKKRPSERRNNSKLSQPTSQTDGVIILDDKSESSDVILISTSSSSDSELPPMNKALKHPTPSSKLSEKICANNEGRKKLGVGSASSRIAGSHKGATRSTMKSKPPNSILLDDRGSPKKRHPFILAVSKPTSPKKDPVLLADDRARSPRKPRKMRDGGKPRDGLHSNSLTGGSDVRHIPVGNSKDLDPQRMSGTASRLTTGDKNNQNVPDKTTTQQAKTSAQHSYRNDPKPQDGHKKSLPSPRNSALVSSGRAACHSPAASRKSEGGIRQSTDTSKVPGSIMDQSSKPADSSLQTRNKSLITGLITASVSCGTKSGLSPNLNFKTQMCNEILPPHMAFPNAKFVYRMHSTKGADCTTTSVVDYSNFPRVKSLPLIPPPPPSSQKLGSPSISTASKNPSSPTWTRRFTARSPPPHSFQKATGKGHLSPTEYKKIFSPVARRTSATSKDRPLPSIPKKHSSKTLSVDARTRSPSLTSQVLPSSQKLSAPSSNIPRKNPVPNSSPSQQRDLHSLKNNKSTSNPSKNRTGSNQSCECTKLDVTDIGKAPQSCKPSHGSVSAMGDSCKRTARDRIVIKENSSDSGLSQDQLEDLDEIESVLTTISVASSSDWSSVASDSETDPSLHSVSFRPSSGRKLQTARKSTGGRLSMPRMKRKIVARGFDLKLNKIKVRSRASSSSSVSVDASASGLSHSVETKNQATCIPLALLGNEGHSRLPSKTTQSMLPPAPPLQSRKRKLAKRPPSMLSVSSDSESNNSKRTKFQPSGRSSKPTLSSVEPGTSAGLATKKPRFSEPHPPITSAAATLSNCKSDSFAIRNPVLCDSHPISTPSTSSGSCKSDSVAAATVTEPAECPSSPVATSGYESDSLAVKKPRLSQPDSHLPIPESYTSTALTSKRTVFPESDVLVGSAGSDCESAISLSDSCEDGEMETSCARTMPDRLRPVPLESLTSCARTRPFPISKVSHPVKQTSDVVLSLPTLDSGRAQQSPILSEYPSGFQLHMDTESSDSEGVAQVPSAGHQSIPLSDASSLAANQSSGRKSEGADSIEEATTVAVTCENLSAKEQNSVPVASKTPSPERDSLSTDGRGAVTHAVVAAEGEKEQKQQKASKVPTRQLIEDQDLHQAQKCISKLSPPHSRRPLLLSHPRISLINSSEQPLVSSPKSTCSSNITPVPSPGVEGCSVGVLGMPRLLSPREEEYNQRLQDTILKLAGGGELTETPPSGRSSLHSSPTADKERNPPLIVSINLSQLRKPPSLPARWYCTQPRGGVTPRAEGTQLEGFTIQPGGVLTHRLGTYVSKGVQAERGMIVDKEVLDSYLAVKLNEALYEMKEQLQVTERQVKSVIEEKERLERALREKVKLIRDLTTTGFKPIMVDQETSMEPVAMATASTQVDMKTISKPPRRSVKHKGVSVATQTEDSISRPHLPTSSSRRKRLQRMYCLKHFRSQEIEDFLRRVPPPIIPSAAQDNYEPKPQDKGPGEKKSVWLSTLDTETCSRCIAIRPQVRLNRALSRLAGREANQHASKEASQHETDGDIVERAGSSERGLVPPLQVLCRKVLKSENRPDSNTSKSEHNGTGASVSASAVGSNLASDDHTGWTLLGPELQGLFKQLLHLFLVLKKLPVEHVLKSRASRVVDLLGHLLSHLPLPSRRDLTEAAQSIDDAQRYRMVGVSTWLFGFKLKELLQILECVRMDSSRLPAYFRAEVLQLKRVTSNTLNFVICDLRHITVLHDASGCEVLSSVAPPPFHSDQLPVPPLPPMDNLLCDDLDDLDSSSSLSSLGSSDSEEEEEGEGPYTAARVIPVIKYNTRNGHVRRSPTLLSVERKHPPIDATPPVTHIHRTPPSTSALRVQSPATTVSKMTPQQSQNTPVRLSTTSPITSHSDHSKAKLAILEHLESQIHRMLGTLSTRSSGQLLGANNSLGGGAVPSTIHQSSPANMLRLNAHDILKATSEQSSKDLAVTLSPTSPVSGIVCTSRIPPKQFTPISNILSHSHPSPHSSASTVPSSSIVSPPANSSPSLVGPSSVFLTATAPSPTTCPSHATALPRVRTNVLCPNDTRVVGSYGSQPLILSRGSLPQLPTTSVSSPASRTPSMVPPIMMSLAAGYLAMRTNSSTTPAPSTLPSQPNRTPPHSILSCPPPTLLTSTKPLAICSVSSAPLSSGSVASSCGSLTSSTSGSIGRSSSGSSTSSSSGSVTWSHSGSVTLSHSGSVTSSTSDSVNKSSSGSVADVSLVSQPNTSAVISSITITTNTNTTTTAAPRSHEINLNTTSVTTASVAAPCPITASKAVKPSTQPNPPTTKSQALQVSRSSQASSTGRTLPVNLESRNQPLCPPISSISSIASRLPTAHRLSDNTTMSLAHQGARSQHTVPSVTTAQSRPSHPIAPISTAFPVPKVQVKTSEQGVVIKWTFSEENLRYQTSVTRYELYAYAVTSSHPTPPVHQWGKVGIIKPLSLPMAVTLTNFTKGQVYLFSVRAFFPGGCSVYSEPRTVSP